MCTIYTIIPVMHQKKKWTKIKGKMLYKNKVAIIGYGKVGKKIGGKVGQKGGQKVDKKLEKYESCWS